MSDVSSSIRRWTILGWGGIGGVMGRDIDFTRGLGGSMVIANKDGRGGWVIAPSRKMSP